jgi:MbtH protein
MPRTFPDNVNYRVVVNHEEQYSIVPDGEGLPPRYHEVGFRGDKRACLTYIKEHSAEMRPRTLPEIEEILIRH